MLVVIALACAGPEAVGASTARTAAASCAGAGLHPTAANRPAVDAAVLCLVDRLRAARHEPALRANHELGSVASGQVASMVRFDYFSDVRPSGQTPMALVYATRYPAHAAAVTVGQNIAWGTGRSATPLRIIAAWMASPPHRELILSGEFRDAGVAVSPRTPRVLRAPPHGAVYAIEFARRF
jgi:uncharacterized protein YkwD